MDLMKGAEHPEVGALGPQTVISHHEKVAVPPALESLADLLRVTSGLKVTGGHCGVFQLDQLRDGHGKVRQIKITKT